MLVLWCRIPSGTFCHLQDQTQTRYSPRSVCRDGPKAQQRIPPNLRRIQLSQQLQHFYIILPGKWSEYQFKRKELKPSGSWHHPEDTTMSQMWLGGSFVSNIWLPVNYELALQNFHLAVRHRCQSQYFNVLLFFEKIIIVQLQFYNTKSELIKNVYF